MQCEKNVKEKLVLTLFNQIITILVAKFYAINRDFFLNCVPN